MSWRRALAAHFGHSYADQILEAAAQAEMEGAARRAPVLDPHLLAARLHYGSRAEADLIWCRVRRYLTFPVPDQGHRLLTPAWKAEESSVARYVREKYWQEKEEKQ